MIKLLNWTKRDLRERLTGVCIDGQYINLNIVSHLSDILSLPKELVDDYIIWDPAHRLELGCKNAKEGKKMDENVVGDTKWLIELDNVLQHIMKHFRFGHNHTELKNISNELGKVFLEFNLFSETRFIEYAHRTYDHFLRMFPVLFEKLKRDESAVKQRVEDEVQNLENSLLQIQLVVDLLFMSELSHLLTITSKEFQRFDVLPFHTMHKYILLKKHLYAARESFVEQKPPVVINFKKSDHFQAYSVWKKFNYNIQIIIETQEFDNVKLLTSSERGRATRSRVRSYHSNGYNKEDFKSIVNHRYKLYVAYLDSLIGNLKTRFEPWPEWVVLCDRAFNFMNDLEISDRKVAFEALLDEPHGLDILLSDEKTRLKSEYQTMLVNASEIMAMNDGLKKIEDIWYIMLTEEKFYRNCKFLNYYALQFLNRSFNECIVESEVSNIEDIQCSERGLTDENAKKLNFISSNGPHPLKSLNVVQDTLTRHFGNDWHFTLANSKWFVSKVVDRHVKNAECLPNSLA